MSDMVEVKVHGLAELNNALKALPDNVARNVLRGAVAAGAATVRKAAVAKAPVYTGQVSKDHPPPGTLKRAIRSWQERRLSSLVKQTFFVGVRSAKPLKGQGGQALSAFYWRFVEFGTSKMAARPFLRPAFESSKLAALEAVRRYLAERIPREADKLNRGPRT